MRNRKIRSVNFNLDDPYEKRLNEHAEKYPNFAGYIKRLIQRDMEGNWQQNITQQISPIDSDDQGFIEDLI